MITKNAGRLLVVSVSDAVRQSRQTANTRNPYIANICDTVCFAGVTPKSSLFSLMQTTRPVSL